MKLRITEPGFTKMNGPIAEVMFVDGVSVDDVSPVQAERIACAMRCETVDGVNPSSSAVLLREYQARAEVVVPMKREDELDVPHAVVETVEHKAPQPIAVPTNVWTRAALEAIADQSGIKGLRDIAASFNVKGTSIKALIDGVMDAQAAKAATGE